LDSGTHTSDRFGCMTGLGAFFCQLSLDLRQTLERNFPGDRRTFRVALGYCIFCHRSRRIGL
jgi:hypothetical protein